MKYNSQLPKQIKRLRARHQSGARDLFRLYPKNKLKQTLGIPLAVSAAIMGILLWVGLPARDMLLGLIDLALRIFPDMQAVLLAGFGIFFGLRDRAFLRKTTVDEGGLTLYQKVIFAFTFTLVLQSMTLMTAFLFQLFSKVYIDWVAPAYRLINNIGFGLLMLLILVSLFSIYQMVMIIFGLAQNYHLHLVLRKRQRSCRRLRDDR
ncbi:hypothetical protein [Fodinibius sp. Rm-B-1B1-1]|uniref:hypothetical protein n=1 Tax=Fodinibius alkaliphilus TaxID=3140241 RepID=UPI00315A44EB